MTIRHDFTYVLDDVCDFVNVNDVSTFLNVNDVGDFFELVTIYYAVYQPVYVPCIFADNVTTTERRKCSVSSLCYYHFASERNASVTFVDALHSSRWRRVH